MKNKYTESQIQENSYETNDKNYCQISTRSSNAQIEKTLRQMWRGIRLWDILLMTLFCFASSFFSIYLAKRQDELEKDLMVMRATIQKSLHINSLHERLIHSVRRNGIRVKRDLSATVRRVRGNCKCIGGGKNHIYSQRIKHSKVRYPYQSDATYRHGQAKGEKAISSSKLQRYSSYLSNGGHKRSNTRSSITKLVGGHGYAEIVALKGEAGEPGPIGLPGFDGAAGHDGPRGPKGEKGDSCFANVAQCKFVNEKLDPLKSQGFLWNLSDILSILRSDINFTQFVLRNGDENLSKKQSFIRNLLNSVLMIDPNSRVHILRGAPGPMGPKGKRGRRGKSGRTLNTGRPGLPGAKGEEGSLGHPGPRGEKGSKGADGMPGEQGPIGITGPIGTSGPPGLPGMNGAKGNSGEYGDIGPPGLMGPPGLPGPPGYHGIKGEKGDKGDAKQLRKKRRRGEGFYGPVMGDSEYSIGQPGKPGRDGLAGPPGQKGERGTPGENGIDGTQGDMGPRGPMGLPGPRGEIGPSGIDGKKGELGPIGPKGEIGYPGEIGPKGQKGDHGKRRRPSRRAHSDPRCPIGPNGLPIIGCSKMKLDKANRKRNLNKN